MSRQYPIPASARQRLLGKKHGSTAKAARPRPATPRSSKIADVESVQTRVPARFSTWARTRVPSRCASGTFNVRTARAHDGRSWLSRAKDVAREIASRDPGVLAVQELGPGRADGSKGTTTGHLRQTTSLERSLKSVIGDSRYQLVRTTPYVKPGTNHGTQGTRILYDTRKFKLLVNCPEKTGSKNYNPSCGMNMPLRSSDSESLRRSAAYAKFADRKTGKRFWVVSVHLGRPA